MAIRIPTQSWRLLLAVLSASLSLAHAQDPPDMEIIKGPLAHSNQDDCGDLGGDGRTLYVNQHANGAQTGLCWRDAFVRLDDALAFAVAHPAISQIWVARGAYVPGAAGDPRTTTFLLPPRVTLYGGFVGNEVRVIDRNPDPVTNGTVLNGDIVGDDGLGGNTHKNNVYHVVTSFARSAIDGFTIRGGFANGGGIDNVGGGLLHLHGTMRVENCLFIDNHADDLGGGFASMDGAASVISNTFENNSAAHGAAAAFAGYSNSRVHFCDFVQNSASVVGGALLCSGNSACELAGDRFFSNFGGDGGGFAAIGDSSFLMISCLFDGNLGKYGGAIALFDNAVSTIFNITAVNNEAGEFGGAIYENADGDGLLANSILWMNTAAPFGNQDELVIRHVDHYLVEFTCIEGFDDTIGGAGNTGRDPSFVDPYGDDGVVGTIDDNLQLSENSKLIDAGNNLPLLEHFDPRSGTSGGLALDAAGGPRMVDDPDIPDTGNGAAPLVDFGAYEFDRN